MIDFEITSQVDELLYGDYDESDFRNHVHKFLQQFETKTAYREYIIHNLPP